MNKKNIYKNIPEILPEELLERIDSNKNVTVERIVSDGHNSPDNFWYDQKKDELVFLLKGSAIIQYKNGLEASLVPGDYIKINAHEKHRVKFTSNSGKTIWLAVHY